MKPVPAALYSSAIVTDQEGPWCDIWSFGMLVLQMYLGNNKADRKQRVSDICVLHLCLRSCNLQQLVFVPISLQANILHYQPNKKDLSPQVEASHAREKVGTLCAIKVSNLLTID